MVSVPQFPYVSGSIAGPGSGCRKSVAYPLEGIQSTPLSSVCQAWTIGSSTQLSHLAPLQT